MLCEWLFTTSSWFIEHFLLLCGAHDFRLSPIRNPNIRFNQPNWLYRSWEFWTSVRADRKKIVTTSHTKRIFAKYDLISKLFFFFAKPLDHLLEREALSDVGESSDASNCTFTNIKYTNVTNITSVKYTNITNVTNITNIKYILHWSFKPCSLHSSPPKSFQETAWPWFLGRESLSRKIWNQKHWKHFLKIFCFFSGLVLALSHLHPIYPDVWFVHHHPYLHDIDILRSLLSDTNHTYDLFAIIRVYMILMFSTHHLFFWPLTIQKSMILSFPNHLYSP